MSYNPSAGQGMPPGGYGQPGQYGQPAPQDGQPGQYGQPGYGAPGYGAPGPYPGGGSPYGMPGYGAPVGERPSTYRGWAITNIILSIFFCLIAGLPMAIAANYYGSKVNLSWDMGDQQGAVSASNRARMWNIFSTILCAIGLVFVIIVLATNHNSTNS